MSWRETTASGHTAEGNRQVAVVDLGSNSWRLVVYTYSAGAWWRRTDELYETVRIGAGLAATGRLRPDAMERGLETLAIFGRFCRASELESEDVHVIATSAIRDAANGEEFLQAAQDAIGVPIEILSARDEAHYGYVAAVNTTTITDGVVLDLGGGSLQLIEVQGREATALTSFALGAVRMTERFFVDGGPAKRKDIRRLRAHVEKELSTVPWLAPGDGGRAAGSGSGERAAGSAGGSDREADFQRRLVGMGGAVRNLAAAAGRSAGQADLGVQGFALITDMLDELVTRLAALPAAERASIPGIKPGRADIILAGALVLETVLARGGFEAIEVTEAGLREGLFLGRTLLGEGEVGDSGGAAAPAATAGPRGPFFPDVREAAVRNLAVQYESDLPHVEHVAALSLQMFDSLVDGGLFAPGPGERELLWAAAMLHDVGMTINYDDHHKHSRYLILSAELPGFDPRERGLIAQISRYHRKGTPELGEISSLARAGDEQLLRRCAMVLRLAEHLERGRDQSVHEAQLTANGHGVDLHLRAEGDLTLPRWSVERYGDGEVFERVFGRRLVIG